MTPSAFTIWLGDGKRDNRYHLFSPGTGRVIRSVKIDKTSGEIAGLGQRCMQHFVALYVSPEKRKLILQVGQKSFPMADPELRLTLTVRFGKALSVLNISHPTVGELTVRNITLSRAILEKIDPTYDYFDESDDDFLLDIPELASDPEWQEELRHLRNPWGDPTIAG